MSQETIPQHFQQRIKDAREKQLSELDLSSEPYSSKKLTQIPACIFELNHLKKLNLRDNDIKQIPSEITRLTNLKYLDLIGNEKLTSFPDELIELRTSISLRLTWNVNSIIPEWFREIEQLGLEIIEPDKSSYKNRRSITTIPDGILNLENLVLLKIWLRYSNDWIRKLKGLKELELDLSYNRLETLPESVVNLTNLTRLDLSYNRLETLPESVVNLTNLTRLNLSSNQLKTLPESVGNLTNLTRLNLSSNQLETLPESVGNLTNLTGLDLSYNRLKTLPESVVNLTNLTGLYLISNQLKTLPESVVNLTNLTGLYLISNQLKTLPESVVNLTNLTELYLISNRLETLPESVGNLTNLTGLYLISNRLKTLPESVGNLTNLTELDLSDNQLKTLPESVVNLTNLTGLYLISNRLETLPESVENLTNLTELDLSDNQLGSLPESVGNLTNLTELYLRNNQLKTLPESVENLTNLTGLDLSDNPLEKPPIEVAQQGIDAIRAYFRQLSEEGKEYIYEAKLLIVGEGGAGKTTLAKKIENRNYELDSNEKSTEGIDITKWSFSLENGQEFRVNIWDFGGQEIYHATHQFFLTKRSLYALVADTRKEDTDFYYWLNVVELLSNNSPLLIVKNEKGDRTIEIDINTLRGRFSNLNESLATNLATNRGLNGISDEIKHRIRKLPHVGTALPKTWKRVRETLEKDKRNYISLEEYLQICEENGFKQLKDKLQLSGYLHDLGVCLHFQDSPLLKNTVILKPEWGTDAVYKVLDDKQVVNNLGRFTTGDLSNIWSDEQYQFKQAELLELMIRFKLCYKIPGTNDTYIAPQLLTKTKPYNDDWWNINDNLILRYTYEFMPKGIITQFIVVMHEYIYQQQYVWRSGVVLQLDNTLAEVIEYYDKRELKIRVSGIHKKDLLTIITHELDKIHNSYQRLKYHKLIPCNCSECHNQQEPYFHPFDVLQKAKEKRQREVQCQKSFQMVNVLGLIDDVIIPDYNLEIKPQTNKTMKNIKIFLASSSELKNDRKEFEIFINRKNKEYIKNSIFLELVLWEDFIDAMSPTRLQDEYNKAVESCDVFVSLFHTKVGQYTEEEFIKALDTFKANGKPLIYTYFKDEAINMSKINSNILTLLNFKEKLNNLGHFYTNYSDINDLKYKFNEQLIKFMPNLTGIPATKIQAQTEDKNQNSPTIEQNFYGNIGNVTGQFEGTQNLGDVTAGGAISNNEVDRSIEIGQGNYNEDIKGDQIDKSRTQNISDSTINNSGAGASSLGDISGTVANTINQLPKFENEPEKQELKELLDQLQTAVMEAELDEEEKEESLEQIEAIASSLTNSQDGAMKKAAKRAMKMLRGTAAGLPSGAALVTICDKLPELISKIF